MQPPAIASAELQLNLLALFCRGRCRNFLQSNLDGLLDYFNRQFCLSGLLNPITV